MDNIQRLREVQDKMRDAGVLTKKNGRKPSYRKILESNKELQDFWVEFSKSYRTEDEAWFCVSHIFEAPKCPICGNDCKFTGITKYGNNGYNTTCENHSANAVKEKLEKFSETISKRSPEEKRKIFEKRKVTNKKLFGDENATLFGSKSFKENLKTKYGTEAYNNREKAKETMLQKYGVDHNFKIDGFVEKSVKAKREKFGNASNYEKIKATNLERYGVEHIGQVDSLIKKSLKTKEDKSETFEKENDCTSTKKLVALYGQGWKQAKVVQEFIRYNGQTYVDNDKVGLIKCYYEQGKCHTNGYVSKKEKDLLEFIKGVYDGKIVENDTSAVPNLNHRYYELDIYLPDLGIAFDFDGNYYHSSKFKDEFYHQRKSLCCLNAGIRLAHILENDWDNDVENLKDKIVSFIQDKNKDFNDGFFPPKMQEKQFKASEPKKHLINNLIYYDTGVFV